jgi:hypothetical protein
VRGGVLPVRASRSLARATPAPWRGRRRRGPRADNSRLGVAVLDDLRLPWHRGCSGTATPVEAEVVGQRRVIDSPRHRRLLCGAAAADCRTPSTPPPPFLLLFNTAATKGTAEKIPQGRLNKDTLVRPGPRRLRPLPAIL